MVAARRPAPSNVVDFVRGTELRALVYVSSAVRLLSMAELDHLLQRARDRNLREGVTGVLLYSQGNFMQYLEGPAQGLFAVFEKISVDPIHHGVIRLLNEPIQVRQFSEWSMAFSPVGRSEGANTATQVANCAERLRVPVGAATASYLLVSKFWNNGLGPYAV